jgi:flagellar motility protein MotE (MotC chaperone)
VARLAAACNEAGRVMCEKCDEIDGKIAHYKGMTRLITDKQTLDGIVQLIEKMKAEKAAFGCDQPDEK